MSSPEVPKPPSIPPPVPPAGRPAGPPQRTWVNNINVVFMVLLGIALVMLWVNPLATPRSEVSYSFFREQLDKGNVASVEFQGEMLYGRFIERPATPPPLDKVLEETRARLAAEKEKASGSAATPATSPGSSDTPAETAKTKPDLAAAAPELLFEHFVTTLPSLAASREDPPLMKVLLDYDVQVRAARETDGSSLMVWLSIGLTVALFVGLWMMFRRTRDMFMGGGLLSGFARSPAKRYEATKKQATFADVAGLDAVKKDLEEIVEFLKNPAQFQRLGGRVPKGVLLMGPPGTGKTLLARAVAGEAGVPFFSISGSEFIQMYVGVGASRVRDLFRTAKEFAPSIIFVDEIDAVGRHRGAGLGGGHDEREQTLNQILSEMDGFSQTDSVIVLAATNRPDVLDPALLRPGRFDRHITVDRPNQKGRVAIFKVHTRGVPLAPDINLDRLAGGAVGLTGADIRNLVNEAALWATRNGKDHVDMDDFDYARDKVLMGPKREEILGVKEKRMTAYHESGHALLAWLLPGLDRLHKVTIIPRGHALGVTQLLPEEDRLNIGERDLRNRLVFILGGRAAEKIVFNEYSAGAENDLTQVTKLARRMVAHWGMSERLGPVSYRTGEEHPFLGREIHEQREFSEHTAQLIDEEIARIVHDSAHRAQHMLTEHREALDKLAGELEKNEVLDESEIEALLGPPAYRRTDVNGQPNSAATVEPAATT